MALRRLVIPFCFVASVATAAERPVTIKLLTSDTDVAADATAVQTGHYEFQASNAAAAQAMAQQTISFSERLESVEVIEAATLKADGRRFPVDLATVVTQLQPGVANMPSYGDLKRLVVIYPSVEAGDSILLTWRRHIHHPMMPGTFSAVSLFARTVPFGNAKVTLSTPANMPLVLDAHGVETTSELRDGRNVYHWNYSADAVAEDPAVLVPMDRAPRVFASSLPDWDAFGHIWASLVADKNVVTPRIQTLADELTAGTTNRRQQAERLYDWVGTHIRWVAIHIGNGSIIPHVADDVLANGYGDCKDQVMLLIALLRAKGVSADPVLINADNSYTLPAAAVVNAFTHCITYLPEWDIYADTTAGGAVFGTLPSQDYGKPVVHAVMEGPVRHRTPVLAPGVAATSLHTTMRLDQAGNITGESVTTAKGPYATALRSHARRAQGMGTDRYAATLVRANSGTGDVTIEPLLPVTGAYRLSGSFKLAPQPGWVEGDSFVLPTGLREFGRPGDGLAGPLSRRDLPVSEPTPCYAGQQEEALSLTLPEGHTPDRLPHDRDIAGEGFRYTSHYAFEDGAILAQRRFVSTFSEPLCQGSVRESVAKAFDQIRRDLDVRFALVSP